MTMQRDDATAVVSNEEAVVKLMCKADVQSRSWTENKGYAAAE